MFEIEYHESFEYYKFLYRQKVGKGKMKHIRDHMWDRPENGGIRDMPKDDNIIQTITDEWIQQYTNEMEYKDVKKKKLAISKHFTETFFLIRSWLCLRFQFHVQIRVHLPNEKNVIMLL